MSRQVLVTGAAGFVGRNLVVVLRKCGDTVLEVDDLSVPPLVPPPDSFVPRSVCELTPEALQGIDTVFHFAARKSVPQSFDDEALLVRNVEIDQHILRVACEAGVPRIILAGSCEIYGCARVVPTPESHATAPRSPYAVGKAALEQLATVYESLYQHSRITVLRLFNIYGPDEAPDAVIPRFVSELRRRGVLGIEGSGRQERDFTYIDDAVRMIRQISQTTRPCPRVNVGSGKSRSVLEIARRLLAYSDHRGMEWLSPRRNEIGVFRADTQLLREITDGGEPATTLSDGLQQCWESPWLRAHGGTTEEALVGVEDGRAHHPVDVNATEACRLGAAVQS
jgi:nucleoside-diphosphate-sugar epimerase